MKKVLHLSRKTLTDEQLADLARTLGDRISVGYKEVEWRRSGDAEADVACNKGTWLKLWDGVDAICGDFPAVALEAGLGLGGPLYTPMGRHVPEQRWGYGGGPSPFIHERWIKVWS